MHDLLTRPRVIEISKPQDHLIMWKFASERLTKYGFKKPEATMFFDTLKLSCEKLCERDGEFNFQLQSFIKEHSGVKNKGKSNNNPKAREVNVDEENPWKTKEFDPGGVPEELLTSGPPKTRSAIEEEISKIFDDVAANLDTKFRSHPILGGVNMIQEEHNCYVPELIYKEKQVIDGRNGYGAKLTNVFSTKLDKLSHKINELIERKGNLQIAIGDKRQEGVKMRNQLNKMKNRSGSRARQTSMSASLPLKSSFGQIPSR